MLTREELLDLSEEELEDIYQEKKREYDNQLFKNQRIRSMLSEKLDRITKRVQDLHQEKKKIISSYLEILEYDSEKLNSKIESLDIIFSDLQSTELQLSASIELIIPEITQQKEKERKESGILKRLEKESENLAKKSGKSRIEKLSKLLQEEKAITEKINGQLDVLLEEVEEFQNNIYS